MNGFREKVSWMDAQTDATPKVQRPFGQETKNSQIPFIITLPHHIRFIKSEF